MHLHYFLPFKDILSILGRKKVDLNVLLPKFTDPLTNPGTSQYNTQRKFDSQFQYTYFHEIKKHLGFILDISLPFFM